MIVCAVVNNRSLKKKAAETVIFSRQKSLKSIVARTCAVVHTFMPALICSTLLILKLTQGLNLLIPTPHWGVDLLYLSHSF